MKVRINGKEESLPDVVMTLRELVINKGLIPERLVIEVNLKVIPRENWVTVSLRNADHIEIVSFVGGG